MSSTANIGCLKSRREMLKHKFLTSKVNTIYKTQRILQLKDIYNLEVSKFMYKYTNSQLPALFNNYFELITDVHPYNTRQIKTRLFALPKARSNSGAKMIKYCVIETWSKIPSEIRNKTFLALFAADCRKQARCGYQKHCVFLIGVHRAVH